MAYRTVEFKNFRNLGLEDNKKNFIILNNSLEEGKMGNLVVLVGANNSGKSNILEGINKLSNEKIQKRDITTLSFKPEDRNPEILICIHDKGILGVKASLEGKNYINTQENKSSKQYSLDELLKSFDEIEHVFIKYGVNDDQLKVILESFEKKYFDYNNMIMELKRYRDEITLKATKSVNWRRIKLELRDNIMNSLYDENDIEKICLNKYGFSLTPNVVNYKGKSISQNDMNVQIDNLSNNLFFKSVFKAIDIDIEEIINGYNQYHEFQNTASLNKLKKMIDKKVVKLNKRFNDLYFAEKDQYKFTIDISPIQISFGMARGENEDPIMIEMQSTGFRWFFDFYFNFICSNELKRGDIIIMDEPATNLHPEGQRELRKFIKEFAINNDLTFIIATHSPFLVDTDNYDELRIVTMENNRSSIDNLFTAVNIDDPDTILPIKESLTIKQNVLYDLDTEVVWVEGLTDYCYLTAFKNLLGRKNISFIPFNGVGSDDEAQKAILQKIINTKFYKRSMLVDGDKAGKAMIKKCKDTPFENRVHSILDLGEGFLEIEDLFSKEDKVKFGIEKNGEIQKKAHSAIYLKTFASLNDFGEETKTNFINLFDILED